MDGDIGARGVGVLRVGFIHDQVCGCERLCLCIGNCVCICSVFVCVCILMYIISWLGGIYLAARSISEGFSWCLQHPVVFDSNVRVFLCASMCV